MRNLFCILLLLPATLFAEVLDIGIYKGSTVVRAIFAPSSGSYEVFGDGKLLVTLHENQGMRVFAEGDKVALQSMEKRYGTFHKVEILRTQWGNHFRFKPISPKGDEHKYQDNLIATANKGELELINRVYIEYYVAGVVEAESGAKQNSEYYKLQSIVCRTYALNNLRRHEDEGFHLCDQVHCQVYHGMSRFNPVIPKSVVDTKGLVVVDSDINLITASFHSNCGGQTINAEDVWSMPLPYLQSVSDTFCLKGAHAEWEMCLPRSQWFEYLKAQYNYPVDNPKMAKKAVDFNMEEQRRIYYASGDSGIPLEQIREDWRLKSTFFRVQAHQDSVLIKGRGFGHGVGMCQEGAMRMADLGFTYAEIIHYYYKDVHLIDLSVLDFFKEY